jgi:general secretion pathway protein G
MRKGLGRELKGSCSRRFGVRLSRPFALAPRRSTHHRRQQPQSGWTLIELVITMTVLAILSMGVIPLVKTAVKRQREQQLRSSLREMREAINEFHRDALNSPYLDQVPQGAVPAQPQQPTSTTDPRSKVAIADKTLFGVDNPDRYPPKLQTLVDGVSVAPRVQQANTDINKNLLDQQAPLAFKKKIYLRRVPDDPMTPEDESKGEGEWGIRSCYDSSDAGSGGGENVFDVFSKSQGIALNGQKYSDW